MISEMNFRRIAFLGIAIVLAVLVILVVRPIAAAIVGGLLLGYMFYPIYKYVLKVVKEKNVSAFIVVVLTVIIIFLPFWFLFPLVAREIFSIYTMSQQIDFLSIINTILPQLSGDEALTRELVILFNNFVSKFANLIISEFSDTLLNLPNILLQMVVVLFVFFFTMRDAEKLKGYIKSLSPFNKRVEEEVSQQFKDITNSVIYGFVVAGIIQGLLTGVALFVLGVDNALLLTVLAILAGIFPLIGSWLIWFPVTVYLFFTGRVAAAIGLLIYGAIFVSSLDNFIRPYIVAKKVHLSSAIVFIGMIGGLIVFGILGLIIGPLIISYFMVILDAYRNKKFESFFSQ
ncbi:MAG: AI-2E family transporter [archaeon]